MSYFMQFWPILGPYGPLKRPWHYQRSTLNDSYSPKILQKIVLPENRFISSFFEVKMIKSAQNVIFHANLTNFGTIWPTQRPLTIPTKYVNRFIFSQNTPKNSTTRKWIHLYPFWRESVRKVPKMSYFMHFWPIFGPYEPLKGPLQYQKSPFNGWYSPKSLQKLVLPENGFISLFF